MDEGFQKTSSLWAEDVERDAHPRNNLKELSQVTEGDVIVVKILLFWVMYFIYIHIYIYDFFMSYTTVFSTLPPGSGL